MSERDIFPRISVKMNFAKIKSLQCVSENRKRRNFKGYFQKERKFSLKSFLSLSSFSLLWAFCCFDYFCVFSLHLPSQPSMLEYMKQSDGRKYFFALHTIRCTLTFPLQLYLFTCAFSYYQTLPFIHPLVRLDSSGNVFLHSLLLSHPSPRDWMEWRRRRFHFFRPQNISLHLFTDSVFPVHT